MSAGAGPAGAAAAARPTSAELDARDPLAAYRSRFVGADDPAVVAYLDGNSLGRPVATVPARLAGFVEGAWGDRLIRSWGESWMDEPTRVGDRLGRVVLGAGPGQVVVGDSTSVLLYKLLRAAAAARPGRREVVVDRDNFPTDRYLVEGVAAECGLTVRWIEADPDGGVTVEDLAPALGPDTAFVLLSHVAFRSAHVADGAALTALVHDAGALVVWDLSHSAGSVEVALDAWGADLAVGCTYKYLNGGPGSPAFAYVRADLLPDLQQPLWGWMGHADPFAMGPGYEPAPGIRRLLTGTPPVLAMQPLQAMLDLLEEAGLPAVRAKGMALTEHAVALADERLAAYGVRLASPRDPAARGAHVMLEHPAFREVTALLWERGVVPDFRPPAGLRVGLSPLSTSFAEVERGVDAIAAALADVSSS
ncbi:aminotransferase class V-fold PLP-dependent enzyme [Nocardioides sp. zg-579]|uniref:Kynureninase n=1 Tax=Nocardioides marmotae TaxID=2663857 RepID=A0A6I3J404_9ACTN|nr:aminotransferase class V-fold PLP-dependent enzyme [Nocardioides marmotae]MCR6029934.1 aminotransferase class V-fold PLP-dependent enzyme [Gordonia jinghuaiqii]MTB93564.1 aminotransferase class V-fold PLP-dependent enzyme [Nocardioides marmotae]QKD99934.1 aminotransferase class V-fold PLP-dependent enzyme [Nocardioides marmotae]